TSFATVDDIYYALHRIRQPSLAAPVETHSNGHSIGTLGCSHDGRRVGRSGGDSASAKRGRACGVVRPLTVTRQQRIIVRGWRRHLDGAGNWWCGALVSCPPGNRISANVGTRWQAGGIWEYPH